jgi:exopolyphosphatase / guanosine-5'-triphosphate,3'-diphosphate pyrophosphatase
VRLATIDLGTNTVRLLVVDAADEGRWRVLHEEQRVTRLGEGLAATGALGETPMSRTAATVTEYVARAESFAPEEVRIVATSAVREAANGTAFAAAVERAVKRRVDVITGEEEARLTLRGARAGVGAGAGDLLLFDIGGGSTEYIRAEGTRVASAVSVKLGVVELAERYPFPGPVGWDRYAALAREVAARLHAAVPSEIWRAPVERLVGTAGTVTTLAALDLGLTRYEASRVQGHALARSAVERLLKRLGELSVDERAALPCLEPGRADIIVHGIAIVTATLDRAGVDTVVVSDWGLREGLVAERLDRGARA